MSLLTENSHILFLGACNLTNSFLESSSARFPTLRPRTQLHASEGFSRKPSTHPEELWPTDRATRKAIGSVLVKCGAEKELRRVALQVWQLVNQSSEYPNWVNMIRPTWEGAEG